jgi:hypothetical protein
VSRAGTRGAHGGSFGASRRTTLGGHLDTGVRSGGIFLSSGFADSAVLLLTHWAVALVLGVALGAALLLSSRSSFRAMTPEAAEVGLALAAASLLGRMVLAAGVLYVYRRFVPDGFVPFATGVAGGFLVLYAIELTRYGRVLVRSR